MSYIETCLHKNDFQLFPNFSYHGFGTKRRPTELRKFFTKAGPSLVNIKHENCFFFTEQNCVVLNLVNLNIFIEKG